MFLLSRGVAPNCRGGRKDPSIAEIPVVDVKASRYVALEAAREGIPGAGSASAKKPLEKAFGAGRDPQKKEVSGVR